MVSCGKVFVLVTAMLCAVLGYYLYVPLPSDATEPWTMRMFCASMHMIRDLSKAGELIGLGSALNNTRAIQNWLVLATRPAATDNLRVTDTEFVGVKVRIYQPAREQKNLPGLVFYHGGGFMMGSIETHDSFTRALARELNMVVVSVEYRLAPEHPYPVPFEDCEKATAYFMKAAGQYGVDPARIGLAGDDAGGNIAAALSIFFKARPNRGNVKLVVLAYPPLQLLDFNMPSYVSRKNQIQGLLTREMLVEQWLAYMGQDARLLPYLLLNHHTSPDTKRTYGVYVNYTMISSKFVEKSYLPTQPDQFHNKNLSLTALKWVLHTHLSPILMKNLKGLSQVYVMSAEHDVLRDDSLVYVRRLKDSDVKVHHRHYTNGFHGMLTFPFSSLQMGTQALSDMVEFIRHNL